MIKWECEIHRDNRWTPQTGATSNLEMFNEFINGIINQTIQVRNFKITAINFA